MKKVITPILFLFFACYQIHSQSTDSKRDHIWLMGFDGDIPNPSLGGTVINFNENPTELHEEDLFLNFRHSNASICDENGELLFYSNGIHIANKNHELMAGGQGLSPGWLSSLQSEDGMVVPQYLLILPKPGSDSLYFVLHGLGEYDDWIILYTKRLLYSVVDMSLAGGLGMVTHKNELILQDTIDWGKLTATRHGNGRDWWILVSSFNSKDYYKLLLSPTGLEVHDVQTIDWVWETEYNSMGQAAFSPDGAKYARNHLIGAPLDKDIMDVFDFDRCTGHLSNPRHVRYAQAAYAGGLAFSGNSRFIYVPHSNYVFQFDTEADDLLESMDTVAVYDGFCSPCPGTASFNLAQLAPNNRIYINTPNKADIMHVIYQPDSLGVACNVRQHEIELPTQNDNSLPNFPNFRLGKWEGSPCDTIAVLSSKERITGSHVSLFPNPTKDVVQVAFTQPPTQTADWMLYDALGHPIRREKLLTSQRVYTVSVAGLPPGLYFWRILTAEARVQGGKLIISK
jgi:hypothetical protein